MGEAGERGQGSACFLVPHGPLPCVHKHSSWLWFSHQRGWGHRAFRVTGLILNTLEIQGPFFLIEDTADWVGL